MPDLEHEEWLKNREAQVEIHKLHAVEHAKAVQARKAAADDEDTRRKIVKTRTEEEDTEEKQEELQYPD